LYGSSVIDTVAKELIIKLVNVSIASKPCQLQMEGVKKFMPQAELIVLGTDQPLAINSVEQPQLVSPKSSSN